MDERRQVPRAEVRFPIAFYRVQIPVTFSSDQIEGEGTVSNLSTGGCRVESGIHAAPGTYLALRLYIPNQETALKVEVAAVRWSSGQDFGAEFISISTDDQARLRQFLNTIERSKV